MSLPILKDNTKCQNKSHYEKGGSNAVVLIPKMDEDIRTGNVFNDIFSIIYQTEHTRLCNGRQVIWDFSQCNHLHPFFTCALSILQRQYGETIRTSNIPTNIAKYLGSIHYDAPLKITSTTDTKNDILKYVKTAYTPICSFNPADSSSVNVQEFVQTSIRQQLKLDTHLNSAISLLLGELIDNITEHSHSEEGFIFSQYIEKEKALYIVINDSGRSIYSSYASDDRYLNNLTELESSGLVMAFLGKSTKDRPESENRGYGISKSRGLVVDGLNGEFYILSGSALAIHDKKGVSVTDLPDDIRWNGTSIFLKIPTAIPDNFNIYNYII